MRIFPLLFLLRFCAGWRVVSFGSASSELRLARADAARYSRLLRCGHGPAVCAPPSPPATIFIGVASELPPLLASAPFNGSGSALGSVALVGDAHLVAPVASGVVCVGATPRGALYAVYTLLEALGARFYLTGDALPAPNASLALPTAPLLRAPVFAERGLNPFHDFPSKSHPPTPARTLPKKRATNGNLTPNPNSNRTLQWDPIGGRWIFIGSH
jgi:hypothetical protein